MDPDGTPPKEFLYQAFWYVFSISGFSTIISYIIIGVLLFLYLSHLITILYAKKFLNSFNRDIFLQLHPPETLPSVSIIKPLKGSDCNLYNNLETYLKQDYPEYEVLFCIENDQDPSHQVADKLIRDYPSLNIKKVKGVAPRSFENPKVSNMVPGMRQAQHDLLWMADANVFVQPTTLLEMVSHIVNGVGLVHQLPLSTSGNSTLAECLEVVYFCTSHARMYLLTYCLGINTANGMSMLFQKEHLKDFSGGMKSYFMSSMEDNRIGKDIRNSNHIVRLSTIPLYQNFGSRSVDAFRKRMVRWSRVRFYFLPITALEPFIECFPIGILASVALFYLYRVNPILFFIIHILVWLSLDVGLSCVIMSKPLGGFGLNYLLAWFLREGMVITNWFQAIASKKINWGGHVRTLQCCTDEYSSAN